MSGRMLYDRDYMRGAEGNPWRSPVMVLLMVLAGLFLVECVVRVYGGGSLAEVFGLGYEPLSRHQYWRLVTYQFLHTAPWPFHLLFNGLFLWFFGRAVWEALGTKRFWQIYLGSGLAGGLVELACQAWHPAYGQGLTVGASASVLGLAGVYCLLFPQRETVFFFYVIPVRMRSMTMFWILFGFSVFGTVFPYGNVAHAAHLGGLLAGAAWGKWMASDDAWGWLARLRTRRGRREAMPVGAPKGSGSGGASGGELPEAGEISEEFIRREVDPILDKISAHGLHSLTERERRILKRAGERMRGR
jgi:membrane associated rhomboid family serine protease